jgi:GH43 family beta-xylosidase
MRQFQNSVIRPDHNFGTAILKNRSFARFYSKNRKGRLQNNRLMKKIIPVIVLIPAIVLVSCKNIAVLSDDDTQGNGLTWSTGRIRLVDQRSNWNADIESALYWNNSPAESVNWVSVYSGDAIDLDGHFKTHIRYNIASITGCKALTLSAWVYWRGAGLTDAGVYADNDRGQVIFGLSGTTGHFKISINDNVATPGLNFVGGIYDSDVHCNSPADFPQNEWVMVTATLDGARMILYINGTEVARQNQTVTPESIGVNLFRIGSSFWNVPSLNAIISQAGVWTEALSAEDIFTMYDETKGTSSEMSLSTPFNTLFYNPLKVDYMLGDPWVIKQGNMYYYCGGSPITIIASPTISGIMAQSLHNSKVIFSGGTQNLKEIWAAELHYYQERWYVFFAARTNNTDPPDRRMYVLRSRTDNAMGDWDYMGKLNLPGNEWAIDGTFFEHNGRIFHIWSGWRDNASDGVDIWRQHLYITELKSGDPTQVKSGSTRVIISSPQYNWEKSVLPQNEGPAVVKSPAGTVYCIYSANYSGSNNYALGWLKLIGDDPMVAANWRKNPTPLLASDPEHDIYSPGHCSITKSPDGTEDWVIYHAAKAKDSGWDRNARAQKLLWVNDEPVMEKPVPLSDPEPLPSGEEVNRTLIHAEDMRLLNKAKIVTIPDGKAVTFPFSDAAIQANISIDSSGRYAIYVRHSNNAAVEKTFHLKVNDNISYTVKASRSGVVGSYTMAAILVPFNKGLNTLTFSVGYEDINIDLIILEKISD